MQVQKENTIGEIVARNFRAASVFERFGLDFCCGGKKSIAEACSARGITPEALILELSLIKENGVLNTDSNPQWKIPDFNSWEPDFLIDYIVNTHHVYVMKALSNIFAHSQKVASVHGANHPEVISIAERFSEIKDELESHMLKEEKMLFPYIKNLVYVRKSKSEMQFPPFGSVINPIKVMEYEHESAGNGMKWIYELSCNYTAPEDACTTYRVLYQELKEFEQDLHVHIHLENNILFPRAIALEEELSRNNIGVN